MRPLGYDGGHTILRDYIHNVRPQLPNRGCCRSCSLRSGGIALAIAWRTIRRCTACFFDNSWIVSPAACPRRISSNSSTLLLLSIPEFCHPGLSRWAKLEDQSGPNKGSPAISVQV